LLDLENTVEQIKKLFYLIRSFISVRVYFTAHQNTKRLFNRNLRQCNPLYVDMLSQPGLGQKGFKG